VELPLDKYSYQARLLPALLTFAPLGFAFGVWSLNETSISKLLVALLASLGFGTLLAQLGRDLGKRKETLLFDQFGGKPTTKLLSHRLSSLNTVTLKRYHTKLKVLLPDLRIPESVDEMRAPSEAAQAYESCTLFLREKTRDRKSFPLVFAENMNYGFRRNLWAWKPFGLVSSTAGIASGVLFLMVRGNSGRPELLFATISIAVSLTLLILWTFVFNPSWVRVAAESYAERLIGSLDGM
jgi:hypothetical protein